MQSSYSENSKGVEFELNILITISKITIIKYVQSLFKSRILHSDQ